jgi:hypothetical protein
MDDRIKEGSNYSIKELDAFCKMNNMIVVVHRGHMINLIKDDR